MFELVIWPQEVILIRWTQPSGPLCLWQCFATPGSPFRWIWTSKTGWTHIKLYNFKSDHWFALSLTSSFCKLSTNTINFLAWKIRCQHFMCVLTFWKSGSNVPLAMFSIRTSHQEGLLEKYAVKKFTQTFTSTLQKTIIVMMLFQWQRDYTPDLL